MNKGVCLVLCLIIFSFSYAQETENLPVYSGNDTLQGILLTLIPNVKDKNKIIFEWKPVQPYDSGFYVIQRSTDGVNFHTIGVLKATREKRIFDFTDEKPSKLTNFYRIKMEVPGGKHISSETISADFAGGAVCRFYPNPVDKLLIVRTDVRIDLQISDGSGKILINQQLQPGMQLVNVSALEKGIYIIILKDKDSNKIITDKLIKN